MKFIQESNRTQTHLFPVSMEQNENGRVGCVKKPDPWKGVRVAPRHVLLTGPSTQLAFVLILSKLVLYLCIYRAIYELAHIPKPQLVYCSFSKHIQLQDCLLLDIELFLLKDCRLLVFPVHPKVPNRSSFCRQTQVQIQLFLIRWQLSISISCDRIASQ
jgi:hypothetical protein